MAKKISAEVDAISDELRLHGVEFTVEKTSGGHYRVVWATPKGETRVNTTSATGSDHRAPLNARLRTQRMLRNDGMLKTFEERKKNNLLSEALKVAKNTEASGPDIIALQELVFELVDRIYDLEKAFEIMKDIKVTVNVGAGAPPPPVNSPELQKYRSDTTLVERQTLDIMSFMSPMTMVQMRDVLKVPYTTIQMRMQMMFKRGLVRRVGRGLYVKAPINEQEKSKLQ